MYDCQKTRELIGLYLDNELEAMPTQQTAAHLEQCASCRREFETIRSQNELLSRLIKNSTYDTQGLRASIEAATIGRHRSHLPLWTLARTRAGAMAFVSAFVIVIAALLYLYGFIGASGANPLYQAAAENHRACIADYAAPDWVRSQTDIDELAASFLEQKARIPLMIGSDYRLTHARVCQLNDERFLHLIYETSDRREASLFVGRWSRDHFPAGERSISLDGRAIQLTLASDLHVTSTQIGNNLLIATAHGDGESTTILLSAIVQIPA